MSYRIVVIAALGYFVDILDLVLFGTLRTPSLRALGVPEDQILSSGVTILNAQMTGLLLGSLVWGILGDKKGRVSVLYGSIFLYSLATLANAFVTSVPAYAVCRFVAGIGLAGELGVAITLVSETMTKTARGYGTTIVAGFGLCGGIAAGTLSEWLDWQHCYILGGLLGLVLLFLRLKLREPQLFLAIESNKQRGSLWLLLNSRERAWRYLVLILLGMPIYFVAGILMIFSPEIGQELGIVGEPITAAKAILYSYIGVALGDFLSGFLSQWIQSRRTAIRFSLVLVALSVVLLLTSNGSSTLVYYWICFVAGLATGYWAILVTVASETFGTNLRATATTTIPNLVRASVVPMSLVFRELLPQMGAIKAAGYVGAVVVILSFVALSFLKETYGKDLNFVER